VSVGRLLLFLANEADNMKWPKDTRTQLQSMLRDVGSLSDHATYLTNKITFLLEPMLGVVNIQQNNIIKIFSVAAVVLMRRPCCIDLRNELPSHAGTGLGRRLPVRT
jgi:magnesium transporter